MRQLLTSAQVALVLGRSLPWWHRNRADLEAKHGFPGPVDGCGMRWDPRAIEAWLDARLPAPPAAPEVAAEAEMIRRAKAMAGGAQGAPH